MEMMLDEYLIYLQDIKQVSNNTFFSYRRDLKKLAHFLESRGIVNFSAIEKETIHDYMEYLQGKGYAIATVTRNLIAVKSFFHFLYSKGYIERNPGDWIQLPKRRKTPNSVLKEEEMAVLLNQLAEFSLKGMRDRAMLITLYDTRIAISNMVNLKVQDVDFMHNRVNLSKNNEMDFYPFHDQTREILTNYIDSAGLTQNDWLFPNRYGNPMSRQGFWKIVKNYARKSGIPKDITLCSIKQGKF